MAAPNNAGSSQKQLPVPKEIQAIENILRDMGVQDAEPGVIMSLYNLVYFYVSANLDDAQIYAQHAKRKQIEIDDIKLAMKMNSDKMFTNPPPRELMMELARTLNNRSLPSIKSLSGPRLPPDRCCLTAPNYTLKAYRKPAGVGSSSGGVGGSSLQPFTPLTPRAGPSSSLSASAVAAGFPRPGVGGASDKMRSSGPNSAHVKMQQMGSAQSVLDDTSSSASYHVAGMKRAYDGQ